MFSVQYTRGNACSSCLPCSDHQIAWSLTSFDLNALRSDYLSAIYSEFVASTVFEVGPPCFECVFVEFGDTQHHVHTMSGQAACGDQIHDCSGCHAYSLLEATLGCVWEPVPSKDTNQTLAQEISARWSSDSHQGCTQKWAWPVWLIPWQHHQSPGPTPAGLMPVSERFSPGNRSAMSHSPAGVLHKDLELWHVSAKFVPRILMDKQKCFRKQICEQHLESFHTEGLDFLHCIVTGDESSLPTFDPDTKIQSAQWISKGVHHPKKALHSCTRKTTMLTFFFTVMGWSTMSLSLLAASSGVRITVKPWVDWESRSEGNAHTCGQCIKACGITSSIIIMPLPIQLCPLWQLWVRPTLSSWLTHCTWLLAIFLFHLLKSKMRGVTYRNINQVQQAAVDFLRAIPVEKFEEAINELPIWWAKCVKADGDFFEGDDIKVLDFMVEISDTDLDSSDSEWLEPQPCPLLLRLYTFLWLWLRVIFVGIAWLACFVVHIQCWQHQKSHFLTIDPTTIGLFWDGPRMNNFPENVKNVCVPIVWLKKWGWSCMRRGPIRGILRKLCGSIWVRGDENTDISEPWAN